MTKFEIMNKIRYYQSGILLKDLFATYEECLELVIFIDNCIPNSPYYTEFYDYENDEELKIIVLYYHQVNLGLKIYQIDIDNEAKRVELLEDLTYYLKLTIERDKTNYKEDCNDNIRK